LPGVLNNIHDAQVQVLGDGQVLLKIRGIDTGINAQHGIAVLDVFEAYTDCFLQKSRMAQHEFAYLGQHKPGLL
jgi:hypothetical protein